MNLSSNKSFKLLTVIVLNVQVRCDILADFNKVPLVAKLNHVKINSHVLVAIESRLHVEKTYINMTVRYKKILYI